MLQITLGISLPIRQLPRISCLVFLYGRTSPDSEWYDFHSIFTRLLLYSVMLSYIFGMPILFLLLFIKDANEIKIMIFSDRF